MAKLLQQMSVQPRQYLVCCIVLQSNTVSVAINFHCHQLQQSAQFPLHLMWELHTPFLKNIIMTNLRIKFEKLVMLNMLRREKTEQKP